MTTKNAKAGPASNPATTEWRALDPVSAVIVARRLRNEMIAKFLHDAWTWATTAIARRIRDRAVYQELSELPDYLLSDIGVRRDQLSAIAYGGLKRPATDLETAVGSRPLGWLERKPAGVAAARQDNLPGDHEPLAA